MWTEQPCEAYGIRIKEFRKNKGLTRLQLAKLVDIREEMIENLEMSKSHPSDHIIEKMAAVFQINPFDLKKYIWCDQESSEECKQNS